MKFVITVLGITSMIVACQAPQQARKSNLSDLIKGEWASSTPETPGRYNRQFWSFDDSTVLSLGSWNNRVGYELQNDTLIVKDTTGQPQHTYLLGSLTKDSLTVYQLAGGEQTADTFNLAKINAKNSLEPSAIWFASGMCFGRCPSLALYIDSDRSVKFFGKYSTTLTGGYSGKVSEAEYASIVNNIRQLPVDSLRPGYAAPWTDDQPSGVMIKAGDKTIKSSAYGFYNEPIELRILLNRLMGLYKKVDLKPDSSITEAYFAAQPDTANNVWKLLERSQQQFVDESMPGAK